MVSNKKNILILLSLIQLNFILPAENFSDEKEGPQKQPEKKEFVQEIQWTKDKFATEYEVEIQDENYDTILTKRTKETTLSFSLSHGWYRYRIFVFDLFGKRSQSTDWIEFEILKAVQPVLYDFEEKEIFIEPGTQPEILLSVSGFYEDTKLYLMQYDRKKVFDVEILSLEKNKFSSEGDSICKVKIKTTELLDKKYFFRAENPGEQIFEGAEFKIKFINRPVIVNFEPGFVYAIKGTSVQLKLTVQNLERNAKFYLISEAGKKMRCEVEEISKDEFNSFVTISCTTAEAGKFAIQVENDERFFDRAEGFVINHAVQPRITSVKDGSFNISSIKNFSVEFGATGIDDSSVVRLVPKSKSEKEKPVTAKSLVQNESGNYTAYFNSASLSSIEYALEISNAGGFKDSAGTFSLSVMQAVDLNLGLGVYSGTVILLYNDVLPDYTHSTFSLGALGQVSVIPMKYAFGYFGFGFSLMGSYWDKNDGSKESTIYSGLGIFELLYQKPFLKEKLRVQVALGGGYSVFGHNSTDGERETAQCPVFKSGVSFIWYPAKNFYVELGASYFHLFAKENYSGLIVPQIAVGARL